MSEQALKPGWTWVKFGDVVRQVKDKVDVEFSGLDRYIAGEHMNTDDLRIRCWGTIDDGYLGPAFHMRFKPGQVLYGSRRTYLRKVAVPDFEGICANTTFVLEAKDPTILLPELLPFIMQTESFNDHSIKQSKGSVNPYVNFSDLAWYEFALPPLEEQRRIAQILSAHDEVAWLLSELMFANSNLLKSSLFNLLSSNEREHQWEESLGINIPATWKVAKLDSIMHRVIDYRGRTPSKSGTGVPLITARNVRDGYLDTEPEEFIPLEDYDGWMTRGIPQPGDVFFTMEAPLGYVAPVPEFRFALAQRVVVLQPDQTSVSQRFLYWLMQSPLTQQEIQKRATGTTAKGIKQSTLLTIPVLVPPLQQQEIITEKLDAILSSQKAVAERLENACFLKKQALHLCLQED